MWSPHKHHYCLYWDCCCPFLDRGPFHSGIRLGINYVVHENQIHYNLPASTSQTQELEESQFVTLRRSVSVGCAVSWAIVFSWYTLFYFKNALRWISWFGLGDLAFEFLIKLVNGAGYFAEGVSSTVADNKNLSSSNQNLKNLPSAEMVPELPSTFLMSMMSINTIVKNIIGNVSAFEGVLVCLLTRHNQNYLGRGTST